MAKKMMEMKARNQCWSWRVLLIWEAMASQMILQLKQWIPCQHVVSVQNPIQIHLLKLFGKRCSFVMTHVSVCEKYCLNIIIGKTIFFFLHLRWISNNFESLFHLQDECSCHISREILRQIWIQYKTVLFKWMFRNSQKGT